jgi:hypothetical protein
MCPAWKDLAGKKQQVENFFTYVLAVDFVWEVDF